VDDSAAVGVVEAVDCCCSRGDELLDELLTPDELLDDSQLKEASKEGTPPGIALEGRVKGGSWDDDRS
jgi:hypothetical protein